MAQIEHNVFYMESTHWKERKEKAIGKNVGHWELLDIDDGRCFEETWKYPVKLKLYISHDPATTFCRLNALEKYLHMHAG